MKTTALPRVVLAALLCSSVLAAQAHFTWRRPASIGPLLNRGQRMVFDSARQVAVLVSAPEYAANMETWEWNGSQWRFLPLAVKPPAAEGHVLAYDARRKVTVLFGGYSLGRRTNELWEFDGVKWTHRNPTLRPPARSSAVMAFDALNGKSILFGGWDGKASFTDTWEWDGTSWVERKTQILPGSSNAMAYDSVRQRMVLAGGAGTYLYDVRKHTWSLYELASRYPAAMAGDPGTGFVYTADKYTTRAFTALGWQTVASGGITDTPLAMVHTTFGGRGRLLAVAESGTWSFDLTLKTWTRMQHSLLPARLGGSSPSVVYNAARKNLFAFTTDETWEGSGGVWTKLAPATSPRFSSVMNLHVMAYDSNRDRVVLVGQGETWEWDNATPGNWSKRSPKTAPPANTVFTSCSIAYDSDRKVTVLYIPRTTDATWEWDGADWTKIGATPPPVRANARMVYDEARRKVVLFGGESTNGLTTYETTFLYDGKTWKQASVTKAPPKRIRHALVYDSQRRKVVLYGGEKRSDTWVFDGDWKQDLPAFEPAMEWAAQGVYDRHRMRTVVFHDRTDVVWEYEGGCEVIGRGHPIFGGLPIRCENLPLLGRTFRVSFTAPPSTTLALFYLGPRLSSPLTVDPPTSCLRAFLHVYPVTLIPASPTAPELVLPIPDVRGLLNLTFCTQGSAVGPARCSLASDALQFTILE